MTTLTREALLDKCKRRFEEVDVEGFGRVGIRSLSEVTRSRRSYSYIDDNGKWSEKAALRRIHSIIDQVMIDESTPMFTEADVPALCELDSESLDPLYAAILKFNGDEEKKDQAGSQDTSES